MKASLVTARGGREAMVYGAVAGNRMCRPSAKAFDRARHLA
jgi:hypothetical protein